MTIKCIILEKECDARDNLGDCGFGHICEPIIDKCEGCGKTSAGYCTAFLNPSVKWRISKICPLATHIKAEAKQERKINPLKQSKLSASGGKKSKK